MKKYEEHYMKNKTIWTFLFRFFGTYALLFLGYFLFLSATEKKETQFVCDPLTRDVANESSRLLRWFGEEVVTEQHPDELCVKMVVEDVYVLGVIEGCNSVSIIILFVAFIIAFKGSLKRTLLFSVFGVLSIYCVNIIRVAILTYGVTYFPNYSDALHHLVFPAIIYGYIFLLWIVWVNYFSDLKKRNV